MLYRWLSKYMPPNYAIFCTSIILALLILAIVGNWQLNDDGFRYLDI